MYYNVSMLNEYGLLLIIGLTVMAAAAFLWLGERLIGKLDGAITAYGTANMRGPKEEAPAWRRYHVHYYPYALLFLAFDMEMAYMYPWAVVFVSFGMEAFIDMGIFLMILFLGLLYAWSQKGLQRQ